MTPHDQSARELCAKLLPHTTSVHNVELISEALCAAHDDAKERAIQAVHNAMLPQHEDNYLKRMIIAEAIAKALDAVK